MKKILAILFLLIPLVANAEDSRWKWTKTDTVLQVATVTLMVVDWRQTTWMMDQYKRWEMRSGETKKRPLYNEINPILGDHPKHGTINAYFIGAIVGQTAIAMALPSPYRRIWQCVYIAVESGFVVHNYSIGAKINF
jgi:hypothetical protein